MHFPLLFPSCMKRSILSQDNMHDGGWMNEWSSRSQNQNNIATMLRVAVSSAVNLPNVETIGKSDPYVVLTFQGLYLMCSLCFACFNARGIFIARGGAGKKKLFWNSAVR